MVRMPPLGVSVISFRDWIPTGPRFKSGLFDTSHHLQSGSRKDFRAANGINRGVRDNRRRDSRRTYAGEGASVLRLTTDFADFAKLILDD
jgi:hypothetical protein